MTTKLQDMVEEEAAAAEADDDEEEAAAADEPTPEPEPEPEPGPEPEPEPQAFAAIGEKEIKAAERARDAYRKKIGAILGDAAVTHECLLCAGLGFLPDLPPAGTTFSIVLTEEGPQLLAQEALSEPDYLPAKDKATCDWCDGFGQVLSGSKNEHGRVVMCTKCAGNGWVQIPVAEPVPLVAASPPVPDYTPNGAAERPGVPDAWGRPPGHQHWGVPPAQVLG